MYKQSFIKIEESLIKLYYTPLTKEDYIDFMSTVVNQHLNKKRFLKKTLCFPVNLLVKRSYRSYFTGFGYTSYFPKHKFFSKQYLKYPQLDNWVVLGGKIKDIDFSLKSKLPIYSFPIYSFSYQIKSPELLRLIFFSSDYGKEFFILKS